jgi:hypothetical protein
LLERQAMGREGRVPVGGGKAGRAKLHARVNAGLT